MSGLGIEASNIRAIRERLGLTQNELAAKLNVSFSTVNRWENGHTRPNRIALFTLQRLIEEYEAPGRGVGKQDQIVVATRDRLIRFDPANHDDCMAERNVIRIPKELGPVRSVTPDRLYGQPVLLVGMRDGVAIVHPHTDKPSTRYGFGCVSSKGLGVNSATIHNGYLYATHSEHGLFRWRLDSPTTSERLFLQLLRGKNTVRCLTVLDSNRIMFIADGQLFSFNRTATTPDLVYESVDNARLLAARLFEHKVYIIASNGRVSCFDLVFRRSESVMSCEPTHLYSAQIVRCMNSPNLLLGMRKPYALLIGLGDAGERISYRCGADNLRFATATNAYVMAVDWTQSHLYIWNANSPAAPITRLPVAQMTGNHIQDLACVETGFGGDP